MRERAVTTHTRTYWSTAEFVECANRHRSDVAGQDKWSGGTWKQVDEWIEKGWAAGAKAALPISEQALKTIQQELPVAQYVGQWEVAGSEPDIGRYLQGVPECMIEYQPIHVSKVGKVVTMCASMSVSASVSVDTIIKRGAMMVGLAVALEECQHSCEIWLDETVSGNGIMDYGASTKILLKGATDYLDVNKLAYWLSHPTVLRKLMFAVMHDFPTTFRRALGVGDTYGIPKAPIENLPEGTIYLPCLRNRTDVPNADKFILDTLRKIGLVS